MCIGQPGVQRREANLGAVTKQKENEGEVEKRRVEGRNMLDQDGPDHAVLALADDGTRGHIDEDRAKQRKSDADAAQDEIFPGGLDRLLRAVDANHDHRGERRHLDRDPHQADVVGDQSEIHRKQQHLIHRMVESQMHRRKPPVSNSWAM